MTVLNFLILDRVVRVDSFDPHAAALLRANYGAMEIAAGTDAQSPALVYEVGRRPGRDGYFLRRFARLAQRDLDRGAFLFLFEKDMTIELEKIRREYFFVHGAAVGLNGRIALIVAASGAGKSTTTWALLHHGFEYASDELAPIDLAHMTVQPYPHALCLKGDPPQPYALPSGTVRTARTLHVPVAHLPATVVSGARPLHAVFFLQYDAARKRPEVHPLGTANAGARLYAHGLNQLAHPADGLDAALAIAAAARCYTLDSADLAATCGLIRRTLAAAG